MMSFYTGLKDELIRQTVNTTRQYESLPLGEELSHQDMQMFSELYLEKHKADFALNEYTRSKHMLLKMVFDSAP